MRILWMRWVTVAALTGGLSGCLMQVGDEGQWNDPEQPTEQSHVMSGDLPGGAGALAGRLPHVMVVPQGMLSSDSKWGSTHGTSLEMGDEDDDPRSPDPVPWRQDQVQDPSAGDGEQMNLDGEGQAPDPVPWREGHGALHGSQSGASSTDGDGLAPDPVPWRQKSASGQQGTQQQQAPQAQGEPGDGDEPSGDGIPSGPGHWIFVR